MKRTILVLSKFDDRLDSIASCLDGTVQPGMKVIFMMRFPVENARRLLTLCARMDEGVPDAAAASQQVVQTYSWHKSMQRAEKKLAAPIEALRAMGVDATVAVYAGSLRKAVRNHSINGDVQWLVSPSRFCDRIACFLNGTISVIDLFRRPSCSPVLMVNCNAAA